MLSILIPTYNFSCVELVREVHKQTTLLDIPFEILVGDDASDEVSKTLNREINRYPHSEYIEYKQNAGPAILRNRLATKAQYPYLLYLDSDILPASDSFIAKYVNAIEENTVVCGGFIYRREKPERCYALRYHYGICVEEKNVQERSKQPYKQFISMNFLIPKEIVLQHPFNETFHLGYEDTLFGMQLEQANVPIMHIDNPVYHQYNERTDKYLVKIQRAVKNLVGHEEEMESYIRLLIYYNRLKKLGLIPLIDQIFHLSEKRITANLCSEKPSLHLFAFYKLGYYIKFTR